MRLICVVKAARDNQSSGEISHVSPIKKFLSISLSSILLPDMIWA